jgi:hypothetical protein
MIWASGLLQNIKLGFQQMRDPHCTTQICKDFNHLDSFCFACSITINIYLGGIDSIHYIHNHLTIFIYLYEMHKNWYSFPFDLNVS